MITLEAKQKEVVDLSKGLINKKNFGLRIPIYLLNLGTGYSNYKVTSETKAPLAEIFFDERLVQELIARLYKKADLSTASKRMIIEAREEIKNVLSKTKMSIVFE